MFELPFVSEMIAKSIEIRGIVEYGENLSMTPFHFLMEESLPEQKIEILSRWLKFFINHQNLDEKYQNYLRKLIYDMMDMVGVTVIKSSTRIITKNIVYKDYVSRQALDAVYQSTSWKIGNAIVRPLHAVKVFFEKYIRS